MTSVIVESGWLFPSQVLIVYFPILNGPLHIVHLVSGVTTPASRALAITTTLKTDPGSKVEEMIGFLKSSSPYSEYLSGSYEGYELIAITDPLWGSIMLTVPDTAPYFSIPFFNLSSKESWIILSIWVNRSVPATGTISLVPPRNIGTPLTSSSREM